MTFPFDADTVVTPAGSGGHAPLWDADLQAGWGVGGGLNGGYLLAVVGRALSGSMPGKPDPLSVSAYFVSAARPGPARVRVAVRREGGSTSTAAAELVQPGEPVEGAQGEEGGEVAEGAAPEQLRLTALATFGDLDRLSDDVRTTAREPDLPPLEECVEAPRDPEQRRFAPLMGRFDLRVPPEQMGWASGAPTGRGELGGWFRLEGGREPDALSLLTVVDALPPVTFDLAMPGWAPTIELTAHVRARPAPGWLRVGHRTRNLAGGLFEEDCEVWDSAGRLVAQSRQLARVPRPAP